MCMQAVLMVKLYVICSMYEYILHSLAVFSSPCIGMNRAVTGVSIFKRLINMFDGTVYLYSNIY